MKRINVFLLLSLFFAVGLTNQSCKPKKVLVNQAVELEQQTPEEPVREVEETVKVEETKPVVKTEEAPNFEFKNIQFEFDSFVLKTDSYAVLDQIYREMRKDPNAKFVVNGHASIEGTADYNQKLSVDRANAVKIYLVNSGVNPSNLTVKGFGATQPISSNDTEYGRTINRRVEIEHTR